jgi:hypothetical protein
MTSGTGVRDFNDFLNHPWPGKIFPELFNDVEDAGDGWPGLQACLHTWTKDYLHSGGMETGIDMATHDISGATKVSADTGMFQELKGFSDIGMQDSLDFRDTYHVKGVDQLTGANVDFTNAKITNLQRDIDFGGTYDIKQAAEITGSLVKVGTSNGLTVGTVTPSTDNWSHIPSIDQDLGLDDTPNFSGAAFSDDVDMNENKITNLDCIDDTVYVCSTEAQITAAISAIGSGGGTIIIKAGTYNLSATINLNGGGGYVIQGQGKDTVIKPPASAHGITITSCSSCVIRDLAIDTSNIGSSNSYRGIYSFNQTQITIDNVLIYGTSYDGGGIYLGTGNNCKVVNCELYQLFGLGIWVAGENCIISNNIVRDLAGSSNVYGIYVSDTYCTITGNVIETITASSGPAYGIYLGSSAEGCTITGNSIVALDGASIAVGININPQNTTTTGNYVRNIQGGTGEGIGILTSGSSNVVVGNIITNIGTDTSTADAYGIYIDASCLYTSCVANNIRIVSGGASGTGCGIYYRGADHVINSNCFQMISGGSQYAIYHGGGSTENCIIGNNYGGESSSLDSSSSTTSPNEAG